MKKIRFLLVILLLFSVTACSKKQQLLGRWYIFEMYEEGMTIEEKQEAKATMKMLKILGMDAIADFREDKTGRMYFSPETDFDSYITDFTYDPVFLTMIMTRNDDGQKQKSIGKIKLEDGNMIITYNNHVIQLQRNPIEVTKEDENLVNEIMTAEILDEEPVANEE